MPLVMLGEIKGLSLVQNSTCILRHAVNPTSTYRMQMIVETLLASAKVESALASAKVEDPEDLVNQLLEMNLNDQVAKPDSNKTSDSSKTSDISCNCTRKCATKKCGFFASKSACGALCHKYNNSCTNK